MSWTPSMATTTRRLIFLLFVDLLFLGSSVSEESNRRSFEWQTLTKSDFSAQIRTQPHLLLLVTLPWSGKSRSLMREVSNKISYRPDKYKGLKLMVVYKNLEKTLADIVGATDEEATLICYRDSTPFRYRGRFRAQNVLASVYHLISQRLNEFPIKPIKTRESLLSFLRSTDRSFLLLETCGWSTRLLYQSNQSMLNRHILENGMLLAENLTIKAKDFSRDKTLKDLNYDKLTCDPEFELSGNLWPGDSTWDNKSASILENGGGDNGISCSTKEFQQFKLFFSKLRILAGDHFLPPEKQRFGFLSDPSLFPLLGVQTVPGWLLSVQYAGCPKCSGMIRESGELKNAVLTLRSVVNELQDEGHEFEPTLPADKSSIILFIDRSSESAKIRRRSVSALEVFRNVALSSHSFKPETRRKGSGLKSILRSSDLNMQVSVAPKSAKYKNHMAFMITKDGEAVALGNLADSLQSQSTAGILSYLLKSQLKGPKVSMIAKKAGFQLLSNDFDVNVVDSSFLEKKIDHSDETTSAQLNLNSDLAGKSTDEVSGSELVSVIDNDNVFREHSDPVDKSTAASSQRDEIGCSEIANIDSNVSAEEVKAADLVVSEDNKSDLFKGHGGNLELPVRLDQQRILMDEDMSQAHEHMTNEDSDLRLGVHPDIFSEPSSSFVHENFQEAEHQFFEGVFYYSDGGYQLLRSLSSTSHVPSAIIFDPILRQHFVYPEDKAFNDSSLVNFVQDYFNGKLSSYHMSEPDVFRTKDFPRPPFVNLDFHEADSIPRVTTNTFSAMALGFDQHNKQSPKLNVVAHNVSPAWRKDVLVLFGNAWCGFCLKMELLVREVYRAFKGYSSNFHNGHELGHAPAVDVDVSLDEMPSIFFMDCTRNDCSAILHSLNQSDLYPALFLFPAENKSAIPYQGELSVSGIIDFLAAHGANSHFLYGSVGKLWTRPQQEDHVSMNLLHKNSSAGLNSQPLIKLHDPHEVPKDSTTDLPIESRPYNESNVEVSVGSVLMATNKLINSPPFDNSTILIVKADKNIGFQGVIVNKRISWDLLNNANEEFLSLKQATLSFGGPLATYGMPLVSIVRSPADEGYLEVFPDFHFGDQVATTHAIKRINSGDRSAYDYWFFLGYSSWNWDQLFDELSEGAWSLSNYHLAELKWLGS